MIPYMVAGDSITFFVGGKPYCLSSDNISFKEVKEGLTKGTLDEKELRSLVNIPETLTKYLDGKIQIGDNTLYYKGEEINISLIKRIMELKKRNYPILNLLLFLDNLLSNPLDSSRAELYEFLEANNLPITDDGCFLAYKFVTMDYKDCWTKEIDNSVGQKPYMDRELVDSNRNKTCSTGFHFCSINYLSNLDGKRLMVVKVNPKDVVSIPKEYGLAKGRCCQYEVIGEIPVDHFNDNYHIKSYSVDENEAFVEKEEDIDSSNIKDTCNTVSIDEITLYEYLENFGGFEKYSWKTSYPHYREGYLLGLIAPYEDYNDTIEDDVRIQDLFDRGYTFRYGRIKKNISPNERALFLSIKDDGYEDYTIYVLTPGVPGTEFSKGWQK